MCKLNIASNMLNNFDRVNDVTGYAKTSYKYGNNRVANKSDNYPYVALALRNNRLIVRIRKRRNLRNDALTLQCSNEHALNFALPKIMFLQ